MAQVAVETSDTGVRTITIDREERRNALDRATLDALESAFEAAGADRTVRAIVLRGAGERAFCAGADLGELLEHETVEAHRRHFDGVARVILAMHRVGVPVVTRVRGFALAGGCGLAVAGDFTIASESAILGLPEIGLGLLPMVVSAPILRASGSRKVVLDLVLSGRRVKAPEALALGLVTRVVPDDALDETVAELTERLAALPPAIVKLGKEAVYRMSEMEYESAIAYLRETVVLAARSDDAREGIRAFFDERTPVWSGR
jgi:enoyl-CoA hydratase/carnithine racemase